MKWSEVAKSTSENCVPADAEYETVKEKHEYELPMQKCMAYGAIGYCSQSAVTSAEEPAYEPVIANECS